MLQIEEKDSLFYRPKLGYEQDYFSEKLFDNATEEQDELTEELESEEPVSLDWEDVKEKAIKTLKDIEKIKKNLSILPGNMPLKYRDLLNKIEDDIENPPPIPSLGPGENNESGEELSDKPSPVPPSLNDTMDDTSHNITTDTERDEQGQTIIRDEPVRKIPYLGAKENVVIGAETDSPIYLFPPANNVIVRLKKVGLLDRYIQYSFIKDKTDMYNDFVGRFKLMIQQYMRELLYISKTGDFEQYTELYTYFDINTRNVPSSQAASADRVIKNQIVRESKTGLLGKILSIDQTIYHLIACKASYEQRQRYYAVQYKEADSYIHIQENDELRRLRLEYDKKYEKNMNNYYKYLTGSSILTDEILKTFLSEARGKAALHKAGVNIQAGYEKELKNQAKIKDALQEKTKAAQVLAEGRQQRLIKEYKASGFDETYSGAYGDKGDAANSIGMGNASGVPADVVPATGSHAEKIVSIANQAYEKRGPKSSNPIKYSMESGLRSFKIFEASHTDCSGFAHGVAKVALGVDIGGNTAGQVNKNKDKHWVYSISDLQPGDFVYFKTKSSDSHQGYKITLPNGTSAGVNHALIYLGNQECIECTRGGGANGLRKFSFASGWFKTNYMESRFLGAFRL